MIDRASLVRLGLTALARGGVTDALTAAAGVLPRARVFPVLTYHRVNDDGDPFLPALPTAVFERQMRHLAATHRVLRVEDLVERARAGTLPRNAIAITFDDGYRDNFTHAAPILARYGLPATIFLATGTIGTGEALWVDRLAIALRDTRARRVTAPWGESIVIGEAAAPRLALLGRLLARLKNETDADRLDALDALLATLGPVDERAFKHLMLGWDDVAALAGLGFSIGAHTVSHPILSRLDLDAARAEIEGSRDAITAACGIAPRAFAYPNGTADDYTAAVAALVRDAGFTCAVTTRFGVNTAATPPFELRRGGPWEPDLATFAVKLIIYRLTAERNLETSGERA